jgi:hypothetical protein
MMRTFLLILRAAMLIGGLFAAHFVAAGERDGDRRPTTNTFVLVKAATAKPAPTPGPSANGVGVAPAKPVVSNPYQVPLLQNAGSLRATR